MRSKRARASSPSPRELPGSANDDADADAMAAVTRRRRVAEKVQFNDDFFSDDARAKRACETSTVEVTRERGTSTISRCYARYPVKVLTPRGGLEAGSDCAWAYSVSMGGGLVSGDESGMRVVVGDSCGLVLATQGTQKVYKLKGGATYDGGNGGSEGVVETKDDQTGETVAALRASVGSGGLLAVLPDPTQIFRDAVFRQTQVIDLARDASCVVVDWLTAGRIGYGNERWAFKEADVRTRVRVDGRVVVVEAMRLSGREEDVIGGETLADRMGSINVFASLVMLGPRVESLGTDCLAWARAKAKRAMAERGAAWVRDPAAKDGFFVSGSEIPARANEHGRGIVLRFFATDSEIVNDALREILAPLSEQLGAPPYNERGGS